ncbi:ATP-binding protein [Aurantiacibacter spongiae]|uniref:ATP-binding protein n=1 Tax=Aurantiacibacter spongiae TaxID=2488860 RepID=UPI001315A05B|nr:ATP-binding protein [Aurantiacibacter spongiae]
MPRSPVSSRQIGRIATGVALFLVPLILAAVFFFVRQEFAQVRDLRETIERTASTRDALAELLVMHIDAETGVRGYVITQNPGFLGPYDDAMRRRGAVFRELAESGDTISDGDLAALERLSLAKLDNAARNIALVHEGRPEVARERIAAGRGKRIMDAIRTEVARLDGAEEARLRSLTAANRGSRGNVERTVLALLAGLALLLIALTVLIGRSIAQRRDALDRAEKFAERQRAMFDGAVDGMMLLDERGRILRMNPSVSRMFGYGPEELIGQHNLALMQAEYSPEESAAWLSTIGAAGKHGAGRRQEFTGLRADGSTFETEIAISAVSGDGGARRYVVAVRDISDRKRAEQLKSEFVSTVSHELRTPLTSIGGSLGLLGAGAVGPLDDKAARLVDIARTNCERLIRLINDILDIEKIESGKMEFDLRRMQVAPLVRRTMAAMNGFAEQHAVTLTATLPPWPQCIKGDPDRLEQLLTNLVSNAIKHSPRGGEVEIFANHHREMVRIEVRDRGPGIPEDFRGRIFGKFAMADASDSRTKGGTGLGLSIAREIARRHGGEVAFEDRAGGGTVFRFDLPFAPADTAPAPAADDDALPRILHVDDDLDTLSVVAAAFAGKAIVVPADTLEDAAALAASGDFRAAIIDIGLDPDNGADLIVPLRRRDRAIPILVFSAQEAPGLAPGADRVLVKGRASVNDLVAATLALLERRRKAA